MRRLLGIPTYGTAASAPFLEAGAVEDVLTEDGKKSGGFVHALEADGAGRELDQGGCRRGERFIGAGGCGILDLMG